MKTLARFKVVIGIVSLSSCAGPKHVAGGTDVCDPTQVTSPASQATAPAPARTRLQAVHDEVKRLGPTHPWAGKYGYSDCGWSPSLGITMAPDAGFVASWSGRDGIYGEGTVVREGDRIHLQFEELSPFGSPRRIPADFILVHSPSGRELRQVNGTEVLCFRRPLQFTPAQSSTPSSKP